MAPTAAPPAWVAAASSHCAYGAATATIAADAGPCHEEVAKPEIIDENEFAAVPNSSANPSQAAAAANIGAEPAPAYICAETISGADTKKLITATFLPASRRDRRNNGGLEDYLHKPPFTPIRRTNFTQVGASHGADNSSVAFASIGAESLAGSQRAATATAISARVVTTTHHALSVEALGDRPVTQEP
ncbi:hypothetical protein LRC484719_20310 [Mycobacterium riyadhense]